MKPQEILYIIQNLKIMLFFNISSLGGSFHIPYHDRNPLLTMSRQFEFRCYTNVSSFFDCMTKEPSIESDITKSIAVTCFAEKPGSKWIFLLHKAVCISCNVSIYALFLFCIETLNAQGKIFFMYMYSIYYNVYITQRLCTPTARL